MSLAPTKQVLPLSGRRRAAPVGGAAGRWFTPPSVAPDQVRGATSPTGLAGSHISIERVDEL